MASKAIAIAGLPSAGKTTYLAAFWHLLFARTQPTKLTFDSLTGVQTDYLDEIAERWLDGVTQKRTVDRKSPLLTLNLLDEKKEPLSLKFPDLSGEIFRDMWEQRDFPQDTAENFRSCVGMMFFIDGNKIQKSPLLSDIKKTRDKFGDKEPEQYVPWNAADAHTQAKTVDLLQLFANEPINLPFRKLSLIISCWDKVDPNRTPAKYVAEKLPLLQQYLLSGVDGWETRIYGVSAQGADYERGAEEKDAKPLTAAQKKKLDKLRELDATERISVVYDTSKSHDLSEPFAWFLS